MRNGLQDMYDDTIPRVAYLYGCAQPFEVVPSWYPSRTVGSAQIITANSTKPVAPQGWQCPRCLRCYSPTVEECKHCKPKARRDWKIVTTTVGK